MRAPSPPATPDPYAVAGSQQMANVEVSIANTALMNADEDRPDGTVRFEETADEITTNTYDADGLVTGTRTFNRWKKIVELTDDGQLQYDQQQEIAISLNTWALAQVGILTEQQGVPISLDMLTPRLGLPPAALVDTSVATVPTMVTEIGAADLTAHLATTRDAIDARLQYQIDIDRDNRIAKLAHQGITAGMTAYNRDLYTFDRASTDARLQAYLAAQQEQTRIVQLEGTVGTFKNEGRRSQHEMNETQIEARNKRRMQQYNALADAAQFVSVLRQQELQETISTRAQNVNEISALMHGGQISTPQFQPFQGSRISDTPVAESVYRSHAADVDKWKMKVGQQQAMMGAISSLAGNAVGMAIGMPGMGS